MHGWDMAGVRLKNVGKTLSGIELIEERAKLLAIQHQSSPHPESILYSAKDLMHQRERDPSLAWRLASALARRHPNACAAVVQNPD